MHTVTALEECGKRCVWEVVLHLKQMDQLWHLPALFNDIVQVLVRLGDELLNRLEISKDTVLVVVLEDSKIRLAWHQQTLLNDVDEAETKEVKWNVHEVRSRAGHQSQDSITDLCTVSVLCYCIFCGSLNCSLLRVEGFGLADKRFTQR